MGPLTFDACQVEIIFVYILYIDRDNRESFLTNGQKCKKKGPNGTQCRDPKLWRYGSLVAYSTSFPDQTV